MIVLDTSIFIDLLFEYNSERTRSAEELLSILEENGLTIVEPDLFKVEFTGQIARRIKKELAPKICEEIFAELVFVNISRIFEEALSNDKHQIESAKKSGIEVYNLLHDQDLVKKRLIDAVFH